VLNWLWCVQGTAGKGLQREGAPVLWAAATFTAPEAAETHP